MTDVPFAALVLAAAVGGAAWVENRGGRAECLVWATLAALERQGGLLIPAALSLALLLTRRPLDRRDRVFLVLLWVLVAGAGILPGATGMTQFGTLRLSRPDPGSLSQVLLFAPGVLGLWMAPLLGGLLLRRGRASLRMPAAIGVAVTAGLYGTGLVVQHLTVYPGNFWSPVGFTPTTIKGVKGILLPLWAWLLSEGLGLITFLALAFWRRDDWRPASLSPAALFLMLLALSQLGGLALLVGLFGYDVIDRYYLPVLAPLIPIATAIAARTARQRLAGATLTVTLLAGVGFYAVAEQDFQAWEAARDEAARMAYASEPPDRVQAGYEANAVYIVNARLDRTGQYGSAAAEKQLVLGGPANPRLELEYARPGDPRPGVDYRSAASGRIIIVPVEGAGPGG